MMKRRSRKCEGDNSCGLVFNRQDIGKCTDCECRISENMKKKSTKGYNRSVSSVKHVAD
jgi:hypothetical protein